MFDDPDTPRNAHGGAQASIAVPWIPAPRHDDVPVEVTHAQKAFETLYVEEVDRIQRYFVRRAVSGDEAQDLTNIVFLRLLRSGFAGTGLIERPRAYISTIAANLLRDVRKAARRHRQDDHVPESDVILAGPDPVAHLEARDMLDRMEQALKKLRPRTREIFLAHRIDGMSYGEIASETGLSIKGVEKHMSKALAQLRRAAGPL